MLNIQNFDDSERFKWCLIRCLNLVNHHPAKIRKVDKLFPDELDLEDMKFPVKVKDVHKIEKRILLALVLLVMKAKKHLVSRNKIPFREILSKNVLIFYQLKKKKLYSDQIFQYFHVSSYDDQICMTVEKNNFFVIVFKFLAQRKY